MTITLTWISFFICRTPYVKRIETYENFVRLSGRQRPIPHVSGRRPRSLFHARYCFKPKFFKLGQKSKKRPSSKHQSARYRWHAEGNADKTKGGVLYFGTGFQNYLNFRSLFRDFWRIYETLEAFGTYPDSKRQNSGKVYKEWTWREKSFAESGQEGRCASKNRRTDEGRKREPYLGRVWVRVSAMICRQYISNFAIFENNVDFDATGPSNVGK